MWAIHAPGAHLGQQRVVLDRDFEAVEQGRVDAHADTGGMIDAQHLATGRQEAVGGVFGVHTALDGVTASERSLGRELCAAGDLELESHEVGRSHELGDRMLDLQAGVHLQEIEVALGIDDELDGAGRLVLHRLGERDRLLAHRAPRLLVQERARRLLDHLLVPALDGAFPLAQVDVVPVPVSQDLDLHVPRAFDEQTHDAETRSIGERFVDRREQQSRFRGKETEWDAGA